MALLSGDAACVLLKRYCEPLGEETAWLHVDFERCSGWTDAALEHVDLVLQLGDAQTPTEARKIGARVRLALGVAQAVSFCRGFDPATSGAQFWRLVVPKLWPDCSPRPDQIALSRATFGLVGLQWYSASDADDAFWIGFFYGTPACDAVLAAVLHRLRPHLGLAGPLPPVRVVLSRTNSYETIFPYKTPPDFLPRNMVLDPTVAMHALITLLRVALVRPAASWTARTQVRLVVDYNVDDDFSTMSRLLELLACVRVATPLSSHPCVQLTVDRLAIVLAPSIPPHCAEPGEKNTRAFVTRGRGLGNLLRTMFVTGGTPRVHTVALLGCSHTDYRLVGAALSAVAMASPSIAALRCGGLFHMTRLQHQLQRLAWLAYTLYYCRRRQPLQSLSLLSNGDAMSEQEREYITQLVVHGTPLRDVVGEALRLRLNGDDDQVARLHVDCLRLGSTVRLLRGTRLYFEPFRDDTGVEAAIVDVEGEELDLVAHVFDYGGFVGVVYAGYGLVWAAAASVAAWHRLSDGNDGTVMTDSNASSSELSDMALASLTLRFEGTYDLPPPPTPSALRVTATLAWLACATLETLALDRAVVTRDDLASIVDNLPRLASVSFDRCVVETLAPLVDAYTRGRTRISSLSLLGVSDFRFRARLVNCPPFVEHGLREFTGAKDAPAWIVSFVGTLARGIAHDVLRELYIDFRTMPSTADGRALLERVVYAVATSSLALQRLHVTCSWELEDACLMLLGPLRGAVLNDHPRVRCAILSVLRACCSALPEVAQTVLAMAEGDVVRMVTWDHETKL
jgi:hypothetical protein